MKKFQSEFGHNYKTYSFSYANYCSREKKDKLSDIYTAGYLPYSGSPGIKDIFYMARSARVPLSSFTPSSENRRVARKFDGKLIRQSTPFDSFNIGDKDFVNFCTNYFSKRHGPLIMPKERLKTILNYGLITHVVSYRMDGELIAYVFEVSDKDITHFWYSFYDLPLVFQSLGMWLMLDSVRNAKVSGKKYFYTGTVYGEKALYKTAFNNIEFWNGGEWIADKKQLKKLGRSDGKKMVNIIDEWKNGLELF
jgi:arginyl-tRNA--protein-N-Asp/Glu arginylyltransferase